MPSTSFQSIKDRIRSKKNSNGDGASNNGQSTPVEVLPEVTVEDSNEIESPTTVGSVCAVKKLWDGGKDRYGYTEWVDEPPVEGEDLDSCEESLQCAILLRYCRTETRNKQDLRDIIIRSSEMRELLQPCVPDLKSLYDDKEQGIQIRAPFRELFFNWNDIENTLTKEFDDEVASTRASLLYDTLKEIFHHHFKHCLEMMEAGETTFDLLWTLFEPGIDIIATCHGNMIVAKTTGAQLQRSGTDESYYEIGMQYIEWDGENFGWIGHSCKVTEFERRRNVADLAAYPLYFHEDESCFISTLSRRGRVFGRIASMQPHMMSINSDYDLPNDSGQKWWRPRRTVKVSERVVLDTRARNKFSSCASISIDRAIMGPLDMVAALDDGESETKNREVFMYCGPCLYGFGLTTKRWMKYHVLHLNEIVWDSTAWPGLVLAEDYKKLVYAFTQAQINGEQEFDDFITGKCQGMVILLAGPPGTGKTLTAESLAEEMQRPLYSVNAVELGATASQVENGLSLAFDLAARWNAIILLDEADVFLAARSDSHLERNSVVAVFLRKLEYFQGMVFLTTNRGHGFDRAFESRIHITIQYPHLSLGARRDVWKRFLCNAEETAEHGVEVSDAEVEELTALPLNGRQIRNMVKSALLLAWHEEKSVQKEHIDVVYRIKQASIEQ